MRLAISFLRTHKLLSSGEACSPPGRCAQRPRRPALTRGRPSRAGGPWEGLPPHNPHSAGPPHTQTPSPGLPSLLRVEPLLSGSDLYSEKYHGVKSRDRTKEARGHLEAEDRKGWGVRSSFHQTPGCLAVWPPEPRSTPEHLSEAFSCLPSSCLLQKGSSCARVVFPLSPARMPGRCCGVSALGLLACERGAGHLPHRASVGMRGGQVRKAPERATLLHPAESSAGNSLPGARPPSP